MAENNDPSNIGAATAPSMFGSPSRPALNLVDPNVQQARSEVEMQAKLQAVQALHQLKESQLKASLKRELEEIAREMEEQEEKYRDTKERLDEALKRQEEMGRRNGQLSAENRSLGVQLERASTRVQELTTALQVAEAAARENKEAAEAARLYAKEASSGREEDRRRAALELGASQDAQRATLDQVQSLMRQLAERDNKIATLGEEAAVARREAKAAATEVERLASIARTTGERLAGAEGAQNAAVQSVSLLHAELGKLRERYLSELSELKAARVGAVDAVRLREQLRGAQEVASALVASREELNAALGNVTTRLAASEERVRRLEAGPSIRDTVLEALSSISLDGDTSAALDALGSELDQSRTEATRALAKAAALEAALSQQEAAVRRLTLEAAEAQRKQASREEHTATLQRMVAELQAELSRLSAQAAVGPPIILDLGQGRLVYPSEQTPGSAAAHAAGSASSSTSAGEALAAVASKLETGVTALRVMVADRGFSSRALAAQLATAAVPPLRALESHQRAAQAAASDMGTSLDSLSTLLGQRPLEPVPTLEAVQGTASTARVVADRLRTVRDALTSGQEEVLQLEERLAGAEGAVKAAATLMTGWSSLIGRCMADGEPVDEGRRHQLRQEAQAAGDAVHRAVIALAVTSTAGGSHSGGAGSAAVAAGDPAVAEAEAATREAQNALLELCARLPDREGLSDSKLRAAVVNTEVVLTERERALGALRRKVSAAPGEAAMLAGAVAGVLADVVALIGGLEEMESLLQEVERAGKDAPVDPVALQGEVLGLRAQLREKERLVAELEAAGAGIARTAGASAAGPGGSVRALVPLDALQASERARDSIEEEASRLRSALVAQRLRHSAVRLAFVSYFERVRGEATLATVFTAWRGLVLQARYERTEASLAEVSSQREALEGRARERRAAALRVMEHMLAGSDEAAARSALLSWQVAAMRQKRARGRWEALVGAALAAASRYSGALPHATVAQRLASRVLALRDPFRPPPPPPTPAQLLGLVMAAWRMWAHVKKRSRQVATLSAGMPALVSALGSRRLLERAWLSWRLAVAGDLVERANQLLERNGQPLVGRIAQLSAAGHMLQQQQQYQQQMALPGVGGSPGRVTGLGGSPQRSPTASGAAALSEFTHQPGAADAGTSTAGLLLLPGPSAGGASSYGNGQAAGALPEGSHGGYQPSPSAAAVPSQAAGGHGSSGGGVGSMGGGHPHMPTSLQQRITGRGAAGSRGGAALSADQAHQAGMGSGPAGVGVGARGVAAVSAPGALQQRRRTTSSLRSHVPVSAAAAAAAAAQHQAPDAQAMAGHLSGAQHDQHQHYDQMQQMAGGAQYMYPPAAPPPPVYLPPSWAGAQPGFSAGRGAPEQSFGGASGAVPTPGVSIPGVDPTSGVPAGPYPLVPSYPAAAPGVFQDWDASYQQGLSAAGGAGYAPGGQQPPVVVPLPAGAASHGGASGVYMPYVNTLMAPGTAISGDPAAVHGQAIHPHASHAAVTAAHHEAMQGVLPPAGQVQQPQQATRQPAAPVIAAGSPENIHQNYYQQSVATEREQRSMGGVGAVSGAGGAGNRHGGAASARTTAAGAQQQRRRPTGLRTVPTRGVSTASASAPGARAGPEVHGRSSQSQSMVHAPPAFKPPGSPTTIRPPAPSRPAHAPPEDAVTGTVLVARTRELYEAVDTLAQGIHDTAEALSPHNRVLSLAGGQYANSAQGGGASPGRRTTLELEQQEAAAAASHGGGVLSPRRAAGGDSMVLTFAPPAGQPERTAVRAWSPQRATGAGAAGAEDHGMSAGAASAGQAAAAAALNRQMNLQRQQQQQGARHAARAAAQGPDIPAAHQMEVPPGPSATPAQAHGIRAAEALSAGGPLIPAPSRPPAYSSALVAQYAQLLPPSFERLPGSVPPVQLHSGPVTNVVPTAEGVLKGAAAALSDAAGANKGAGKAKRYAHVPSRLYQETVATMGKRRSEVLPGGTPNLTSLPPVPYQPIMAPLTTYIQPSRSTPGPLSASALLQGGVAGGTAALMDAMSRRLAFNAFDQVYGTALASTLAAKGLPMVSGAAAAATLGAGTPSSPRPAPTQTAAGSALGDAAQQHELNARHSSATSDPQPPSQSQHAQGQGQTAPAPADPPTGGGGALTGPQQAALLLQQVQGSGNLTIQPLQQDGQRVIRFERQVPAPGYEGGDSAGVGGGGHTTSVPVTLVRLPEPVRFEISSLPGR